MSLSNITNSIQNFFNVKNSNVGENSILFAQQNMSSLRKNFNLLVSNLQCFPILPDFLFITEIWIYNSEVNLFKIPKYCFYASTNDNYAAGGVGVFIKDNYICNFENINMRSADLLKVTCNLHGEPFTIVCVYRLHDYTPEFFINEFSPILRKLKCKNLIILGDFNIDIISSTHYSDLYLTLMAECGLHSFVNEITRPSSGTCIDHIFIRLNKITMESCFSSVIDLGISDHCFISLFLGKLSSNNTIRATTYTTKRIDYSKLNESLRFEFWLEVYMADNVDLAYEFFIEKLNFYISRCTYTSIKNVNNKHTKLKPWMSTFLLRKIRRKNKLAFKLNKNRSNFRLKNRYKKLCKNVKSSVKKTRDKYYRKKFQEIAGNSKKEWNLVDEIISNKKRNKIAVELSIDNVICSDEFVVANSFNNHFSSISNLVLSNNVSASNCDHNFDLVNDTMFDNCFVFNPFCSSEILDIIKSLKNTNSSGVDGISNKTLKHIAFNIVDVLAFIFNSSVFSGIFPKKLKAANILALFKKGDRRDVNNYRPISLVSSISKVFEKGIKNRMLKFLKKIRFLSNKQFGFKKHMSTEDALLDFCTNIFVGLDQKKNCAGLFIDITKAFDTVNHDILIHKLYRAGFRGFILDWFKSYLKNRTQRVVIGEKSSDVKYINIGVPQGTVLGPLLFLIYINSIFLQKFKGCFTGFADDLGFSYATLSRLELIAEINYDLDILRRWFSAHVMLISSKTKLMFFGLNSQHNNPDICFNFHSSICQKFLSSNNFSDNLNSFNENLNCNESCFEIDIVNEFKYLGVIIDKNLNWLAHITALKSYLRSCLRMFYNLNSLCSTKLMKCLYYGIFHSKVQYGICCWGSAYENKIKHILIAQKSAIRKVCCKSYSTNSMPLFRNLSILPVRQLYIYRVLKLFFIRGGYLNTRERNYGLRNIHSFKVDVPIFRTTAYRNFYSIVGCRIFNLLPLSIRSLNVKSKFLKSIKSWLLNFNHDEIEFLLRPST